MKILLGHVFALGICASVFAQKSRNIAWYIPSTGHTYRINGLAIGPICGASRGGNVAQMVNGLQLEFIGQGIVPPIFYYNSEAWDAYLSENAPFEHKVNGVVISPGGFAGLGKVVNGINLSGLNTETSRINGISTGLLFCLNQRVNGLSAGIYNYSDTTRGLQLGLLNSSRSVVGLQIGLFNRTTHLKGVQIGLWNKNGKRKSPLVRVRF